MPSELLKRLRDDSASRSASITRFWFDLDRQMMLKRTVLRRVGDALLYGGALLAMMVALMVIPVLFIGETLTNKSESRSFMMTNGISGPIVVTLPPRPCAALWADESGLHVERCKHAPF